MNSLMFVGGKELGARCLTALIKSSFNIVLIVGRSDDYGGSYKTVKDIAKEHNIPYKEKFEKIQGVRPDIGFCVMYPNLLSEEMLAYPQFGFFNLHGAPLPQYRGSMGHVWAIINCEKNYGVCIHKMESSYDTGDLWLSKSFRIRKKETGWTLHEKAVKHSYLLFIYALKLIKKKQIFDYNLEPQKEEEANYYSKQTILNKQIPWNKDSNYIERFVRAMLYKGVLPPYTVFNGIKIYVNNVSTVHKELNNALPGEIVEKHADWYLIQTGRGLLKIHKKAISCQEQLPKLEIGFILT